MRITIEVHLRRQWTYEECASAARPGKGLSLAECLVSAPETTRMRGVRCEAFRARVFDTSFRAKDLAPREGAWPPSGPELALMGEGQALEKCLFHGTGSSTGAARCIYRRFCDPVKSCTVRESERGGERER